ncbi:classical arabinogalactan protein 9-like [Aristolochia californica]|uniref:classical arabinogalactan protein 9-like n=1 Tax=Aristolochia californica TaxID=171875 RepID=UPI0035E2888B
MAKTNKYTSINFNEIYGPKKPSSSAAAPPPAASQNAPISTTRPYGRMLVLTRPSTPHPPPPPLRPQTPPQKPADPSPPFPPDTISLRPLGRTNSSTTASPYPIKDERDHFMLGERDQRESQPVTLPKPEPFVPPHLRPGFVGREENFGLDREKQGFRPRDRNNSFGQGQGQGQGQGHAREGEDGRPKSGGYYEGMNRSGSDSDRNRLGSFGNRPRSGGGSYGSFYRSPPY